MCIKIDDNAVVRNGQLRLWKVVRKDDVIGIWGETENGNETQEKFQPSINVAKGYCDMYGIQPAQFHCFFTRKDARRYDEKHKEHAKYWSKSDPVGITKIIKVYADSSNVISIGVDKLTGIRAISVSKMEIKSLKHQR